MNTTKTAGRRRPRPRPTPRTGSFAPIPPVPVPRPSGGTQQALFGDTPTDTDRPGRRADHATADVDLIATVLRLAIEPGYLLLGPAEHVVRRHDTYRDHTEPVPAYESETVAQLLDSGHLQTGGTRHITHDGRSRPAVAVLVPARTRQQLDRWRLTGVTTRTEGKP